MARAHVYFRKSHLHLCAMHALTTGLGLAGLPALCVDSTVGDEALGSAVRNVLAGSRDGVAESVDHRAAMREVLAALGVRSWGALHRTAHMCVVHLTHDGLRLVPTRNGGTTGPGRGFHDLDAAAVLLPATTSDEELGRALRSTRALCE